ncbi:WXG100 family type VII secretion target [Nocardia amikacinitolerans]|uniref:WXG100 family type VII secretion target n=1 Tax=Nocardia amikacinitolerans TaxID=756689 RepID=UPI0020A280F1|nr:WXG100 family type VII secretion target [Nocardia amikacinitolerans]MCP2276189.1 WXG100 family type VII secretion target [Nocardia amikacinitolerans]
MAEGSLQADPAALRQAATDLRGHHFRLHEALSAIRAEQDSLTQVWTGTAADQASAVWEEIPPRLGTHFDKINEFATSLTATAAALTDQDSHNAGAVTAVTSSLDLP